VSYNIIFALNLCVSVMKQLNKLYDDDDDE